ncbi:hypothetical protein M5D96_006510 [Drosophila gunungcola]|uniref:Uncharacterized protein n=1 Tax=Drosophila gunungcola TaxID=103775 RepID=A0A9Q0BQ77_9MUSC|nr:hypothetical protein M5D96_006510 [Drosophila gunungcola]
MATGAGQPTETYNNCASSAMPKSSPLEMRKPSSTLPSREKVLAMVVSCRLRSAARSHPEFSRLRDVSEVPLCQSVSVSAKKSNTPELSP